MNEILQNANWLHLDLKGVIPSAGMLQKWIKWFAEIGFNGIVFEYEDRIDWKTWPGVFRGGYTEEEHRDILECCRENNLDVIPLIQTIGHLQWLLKHEEYAYLKEGERISELCPLKPESHELMLRFIDECAARHPESRFIHLGADEAWTLGTCRECAGKARNDPRGKLGLYVDYVAPLCRHALSKGLTPIIWGDMFYREDNFSLLEEFPAETVCVDWQYLGEGPFDNTLKIIGHDRKTLGASAISSGCNEQYYLVQQRLVPHIRNVVGWHEWHRQYGIGVIHTCWSRSSSLWPIYGPWYGQIPVFLAAGNPEQWQNHPLKSFFEEVDQAMERDSAPELEKLSRQAEELAGKQTGFESEALKWWAAALL